MPPKATKVRADNTPPPSRIATPNPEILTEVRPSIVAVRGRYSHALQNADASNRFGRGHADRHGITVLVTTTCPRKRGIAPGTYYDCAAGTSKRPSWCLTRHLACVRVRTRLSKVAPTSGTRKVQHFLWVRWARPTEVVLGFRGDWQKVSAGRETRIRPTRDPRSRDASRRCHRGEPIHWVTHAERPRLLAEESRKRGPSDCCLQATLPNRAFGLETSGSHVMPHASVRPRTCRNSNSYE